ncbi:hypothetical protein BDI4_590070 [Burkholderia diffusa]|nr:hypothetical protein BDI4_590070 [Burkholderia diffusa]
MTRHSQTRSVNRRLAVQDILHTELDDEGAAELSKLRCIAEPAVALAFRRARFGVEPVTREMIA